MLAKGVLGSHWLLLLYNYLVISVQYQKLSADTNLLRVSLGTADYIKPEHTTRCWHHNKATPHNVLDWISDIRDSVIVDYTLLWSTSYFYKRVFFQLSLFITKAVIL